MGKFITSKHSLTFSGFFSFFFFKIKLRSLFLVCETIILARLTEMLEIVCDLLQIRILVSREFLEAVENKVLRQRPSWRVDAAKVNPLCDSVLLIADHSIFPRGMRCILTLFGQMGLLLVLPLIKDDIIKSVFYACLSVLWHLYFLLWKLLDCFFEDYE